MGYQHLYVTITCCMLSDMYMLQMQRAGTYTLDNLLHLVLGQSYPVSITNPNGGVGTVVETSDSPAIPFRIVIYVPPPPPPPPPPATFAVIITVINLVRSQIEFYGEWVTIWHPEFYGGPLYGVEDGFTIQAAVNGNSAPAVTGMTNHRFTGFPQPKRGDVIEGRFAGVYYDPLPEAASLPGYVSIVYSGQSTVYLCMRLQCDDVCYIEAYQGAGCPQGSESLSTTNQAVAM